jgi:hypothetical protein
MLGIEIDKSLLITDPFTTGKLAAWFLITGWRIARLRIRHCLPTHASAAFIPNARFQFTVL